MLVNYNLISVEQNHSNHISIFFKNIFECKFFFAKLRYLSIRNTNISFTVFDALHSVINSGQLKISSTGKFFFSYNTAQNTKLLSISNHILLNKMKLDILSNIEEMNQIKSIEIALIIHIKKLRSLEKKQNLNCFIFDNNSIDTFISQVKHLFDNGIRSIKLQFVHNGDGEHCISGEVMIDENGVVNFFISDSIEISLVNLMTPKSKTLNYNYLINLIKNKLPLADIYLSNIHLQKSFKGCKIFSLICAFQLANQDKHGVCLYRYMQSCKLQLYRVSPIKVLSSKKEDLDWASKHLINADAPLRFVRIMQSVRHLQEIMIRSPKETLMPINSKNKSLKDSCAQHFYMFNYQLCLIDSVQNLEQSKILTNHLSKHIVLLTDQNEIFFLEFGYLKRKHGVVIKLENFDRCNIPFCNSDKINLIEKDKDKECIDEIIDKALSLGQITKGINQRFEYKKVKIHQDITQFLQKVHNISDIEKITQIYTVTGFVEFVNNIISNYKEINDDDFKSKLKAN
tara:strand:- start:20358 stop:21896 length:1539 start_codon:yes stop_codon:yes gene_type:complete